MKLGGRGGFPGPAGIKQASAPSSSRWALLWGGGASAPSIPFPILLVLRAHLLSTWAAAIPLCSFCLLSATEAPQGRPGAD